VVAEVFALLLVGLTALRQRPRASKDLPRHHGARGAGALCAPTDHLVWPG
jgi:hypothetical protein